MVGGSYLVGWASSITSESSQPGWLDSPIPGRLQVGEGTTRGEPGLVQGAERRGEYRILPNLSRFRCGARRAGKHTCTGPTRRGHAVKTEAQRPAYGRLPARL